jgi:hypothetical protein
MKAGGCDSTLNLIILISERSSAIVLSRKAVGNQSFILPKSVDERNLLLSPVVGEAIVHNHVEALCRISQTKESTSNTKTVISFSIRYGD